MDGVVLASAGFAGWLALVVLVVFMPVGWWVVWQLWHSGERRDHPNSYSWEERERKRRIFPMATLALTAGCFALAFERFVGQHTSVERTVAGVAGLIAVVAIALALSVEFLGRPRWCIAPVLRDGAGRKRGRSDPHAPPAGEPSRSATQSEWIDGDTEAWIERTRGRES